MKTLLLISMVVFSLTANAAETELEKQCNAGDASACKKDFQQHFVGDKDQITNTHTWWNGWAHQLESSLWKATQNFNGFVIFQHPAEKYGIALSEKGIGEVHIGDSLKYSAQCIQYGGNADMVNNRGQKIVIRIYQAVKCPGGL